LSWWGRSSGNGIFLADIEYDIDIKEVKALLTDIVSDVKFI
jgi:hypothetical protein